MITAAESNGEGKNALAACERWWSTKTTRSRGTPASSRSRRVIPRRSVSQARIECDEGIARGLAHRGRGRQHAAELDLRVLVERDVVDRAGRLEAELDRARAGTTASCFLRVKRSSSAASTSAPSSTRAAAASWK